MSTKARALAATWILALLAAGCPDRFAQLCPPGTKSAGTFTATLTFQPGTAGECRVVRTTDGGAADASLGVNPAPRDSAICTGAGPDGGGLVFLAFADSVRSAPLGDGGSFLFQTATRVDNSSCACSVSIAETVSGQLLPAQLDGAVSYDPDGGLTVLRGYTGSVLDEIDGGAPDCLCNVPCSLRFALAGTRQ